MGDETCPLTGKPIVPAPPPRRPAPRAPAPPAPPAAAPAAPPPPPIPRAVRYSPGVMALVGKVVDRRYVIRSVMGEGGMGAVYEAEHMVLGRMVALKVLHPANAARPESVSRFQHEAKVVSSIGHPNICELYDVGKLEDGTPFLVMERLIGDTLSDRINREGALPHDEVIDTLVQILGALAAAHRKGIIHRDIKPENIFLARTPGSPEPIAKLLDFGISKMTAIDSDLHLTRTGMVMGTPYYMAPEQARGDQIDQRVDLYAVGVILYECLTGKRPFTAPNYNALLVQILSGQPRPIRALRPALSEAIDPVVVKAMHKQPDRRFQTAAEFHDALLRLRSELKRESLKLEAARKVAASQPPPPLRPRGSLPAGEGPAHHPPAVPETSAPPAPRVAPPVGRPPEVPPLPRIPIFQTGSPSVSDTLVDDIPATFDDSTRIEAPRPPSLADFEAPRPAPMVAAPPLPIPSGEPTLLEPLRLPSSAERGDAPRPPPTAEDRTTQSRPLGIDEAEEIIRAAQKRARSAAPVPPPVPASRNPLRPAARPEPPASSRLDHRPSIPREEPLPSRRPSIPRPPSVAPPPPPPPPVAATPAAPPPPPAHLRAPPPPPLPHGPPPVPPAAYAQPATLAAPPPQPPTIPASSLSDSSEMATSPAGPPTTPPPSSLAAAPGALPALAVPRDLLASVQRPREDEEEATRLFVPGALKIPPLPDDMKPAPPRPKR